jgi:transposase
VLQALGVTQKTQSTFVLDDPSEILEALVGLKDVRVVHYRRRASDVELCVEQIVENVRCPKCRQRAYVKERPVVTYVDLPVYGARCPRLEEAPDALRERGVRHASWVLRDHRIAAKNCLLTTRAAKWATIQVGTGRTVRGRQRARL